MVTTRPGFGTSGRVEAVWCAAKNETFPPMMSDRIGRFFIGKAEWDGLFEWFCIDGHHEIPANFLRFRNMNLTFDA